MDVICEEAKVLSDLKKEIITEAMRIAGQDPFNLDLYRATCDHSMIIEKVLMDHEMNCQRCQMRLRRLAEPLRLRQIATLR